ncbi:hypothetical protein FQN54_008061 [Arachnomyces sp. PD_36]|nr:hypothetical protein FQN54_008061 [Arachnomyces sp. PD_36]
MAAVFSGLTNALPAHEPLSFTIETRDSAACPFKFCGPDAIICPNHQAPQGGKDVRRQITSKPEYIILEAFTDRYISRETTAGFAVTYEQ